jgi:hypothetical protein
MKGEADINLNLSEFGKVCWQVIQRRPFGERTKQDWQLDILEAAIDAGVVEEDCAEIASNFQIDLRAAEGLLMKLALRRESLTDEEAIRRLLDLLPDCEVVTHGKHLSIPLNEAALKIWLERRLTASQKHPGESVRYGVVKITPVTLLGFLDDTEVVPSPVNALEKIDSRVGGADWVANAKQDWKEGFAWRETLATFGSVTNLIAFLPKLGEFGG